MDKIFVQKEPFYINLHKSRPIGGYFVSAKTLVNFQHPFYII
jgi:hypothetical protein